MPQIEIQDELAARIINSAPVDWQAIADAMTASERDEVSRKLENSAVWMSRAAAYFEERGGYGCGDQGHSAAVKVQSKQAEKVRRALGFSYPKQNITF